MALPTITLVNLTGGDINLEQLAVVVPGSGSIDVSDFDRAAEVLNDAELQVEMDAGNIRIDLTGGGLSSADSTKTLEQSKGIVKPIHDLDIKHNMAGAATPIVSDDEDAGYEVGSVWVDTTADAAFRCVDASSGAAVWQAAGAGASTFLSGTPGLPYNDLQFYIDPNNPTSFDGSTTPAAISDLRENFTSAGTVTSVTIVDGNWRYGPVTSNIDMGVLPAAVEDIYDIGGTVDAWARVGSDGQGTFGRIIDTSDTLLEGWILFVREEAGGLIKLSFQCNFTITAGIWTTTDRVITLDQLTHVTVSYKSDDVANNPIFYIDEVEYTVGNGLTETSTPDGVRVSDSGNSLIVGNRSSGDRTFDGDIGPVRLWSTTLTFSEAQSVLSIEGDRYEPGVYGINSYAAGRDGQSVIVHAGDFEANSFSNVAGNLLVRAGDSTNANTNNPNGTLTLRSGDGRSPTNNGGAGAPYAVTLRAGENNVTTSATAGKNSVLIKGGDIPATVTQGSNLSHGGDVTVQGGDVISTGGNNMRGGNVFVLGGQNGAGATVSEGFVVVRSGPPHTTQFNKTTGSVTISTGYDTVAPFVSAGTGDISINTSENIGTSGFRSGNIEIRTGDTSQTANNTSGKIDIIAGDEEFRRASLGSPDVTIQAGTVVSDTGNRPAGSISLTAGDQLNTSFDNSSPGGSITMTAGDSVKFSSSSGGGEVSLTAGNHTLNSNAARGGEMSLTAGDVTSTVAGAIAGSVTITSGSCTGNTGTPGAISLIPGTDTGAGIGDIVLSYATWPSADGAADTVLTTDGAGTLSWGTGSASPWADVLAAGNISGGTDAVMSIGDSLTGVDSADTVVDSGDLVLRAGNKTALTGAADPGAVTIDGGSSKSTSVSSGGGHVTITSGNQIAASGGAPSGTLFLSGATPTNTSGTGGAIVMRSGDGATGGGNAFAGDISIIGGNAAVSTAAGGSITITGGDSLDALNNGAPVTITAGANTGTGSGGSGSDLTMSAGASVVDSGGDVYINGGDMSGATTAADTGGSITLTAGTGTTPSYNIGSINLIVPSPTTPSADNVASGNVNITAGDNGIRNNPGGAINLTAGDTFGGFPNDGGMINMTPGTSLLGDDGRAKIGGTGTLEMVERAAKIANPAAASGYWWVRSDSPNVPMFTDDGGGDWVLNDTGAADLQEAYEGGNTIVTDGGNGNLDVSGTQSISLTSSLGTISLDCTGSGNFSCSSGTLLLSALNVNVTALGANAPGDITLTGSTAAGLGNAGGDIIAISGGGDAAGAGGQASISAGTAGATGVGGLAKLRGGQGGATSGDGGAVSITGGQVTEGIGGAVIISAGDAAGTAHLGGAVTITAGDGVTTSTGGQATIQAGEGGATGNGGKVNVLAGAGGATSGNGGGVGISSGVPVDGDGGTIGLIAAHGVGVNKSGGTITLDAGNSTGTTAGAEIDITSGDGSASSVGGAVNITGGDGRTGGDVVITSGGPLGALEAGDVRIIADKAGGTAGKITLTTESDDVITAPVAISTQSGFVDQAAEHRTFASSDAITNGVTNQVVVDLGSITTNGHNLKVVLSCTATDAVTDSNFVSYRYVGDFYRSGGTVTAVTAFEDTNTLVGTANWTSNISFHIGISGGTVRLELDNAGGSGTDNFNLAIGTMSVVQLGGRTA